MSENVQECNALRDRAVELGAATRAQTESVFYSTHLRKIIAVGELQSRVDESEKTFREISMRISAFESDPLFSERTIRNRKTLVFASAVALSMTFLGVVPTAIEALGLTFAPEQREYLLRGGSLVVLYFLAMFGILARAEKRHWIKRVNDAKELQVLARMTADQVSRDINELDLGIKDDLLKVNQRLCTDGVDKDSTDSHRIEERKAVIDDMLLPRLLRLGARITQLREAHPAYLFRRPNLAPSYLLDYIFPIVLGIIACLSSAILSPLDDRSTSAAKEGASISATSVPSADESQ